MTSLTAHAERTSTMPTTVLAADRPAHESPRSVPRPLAPVMRALTGMWGEPDRRCGDFVVWLWGPSDQAHVDLAEKRLVVVADGERQAIQLIDGEPLAVAA